MNKRWSKIKYKIRTMTNNSNSYGEKHMKIKSDSNGP